MIPYNRDLAVAYARKYALQHNPNYYHFGGIGGDCTNYISQCLLAGGGVMNFDKYFGWYYVDSNNRSPSWTGVEYFDDFLFSGKTPGFVVERKEISKLEIGDLIQLRQNKERFNHTLIISKIVNGQIFVCAHSNNALDRPFSDYRYFEARGVHIIGVKR